MPFRSEKPCSRFYARAAALLLPLFAIFAARNAHAVVTVVAASHGSSSGNAAWYGISTIPGAIADTDLVDAQSLYINHTGFNLVNVSQTQSQAYPYQDMLLFDVTSDNTSLTVNPGDQIVLEITALNSTGTSPFLVPIAGVGNPLVLCSSGGSGCYQDPVIGGTYFFAVPYSVGSTLRVGIYPQDICTEYAARSGGQAAAGCTAGNTVAPTSNNPAIMQLNFNITVLSSLTAVPQPNPAPAPLDQESTTPGMYLHFQADKPTTTCNIATGLYNPGDAQIFLNTDFFGMSSGTGAAGQSVLAVIGGIGATVNFATLTSSLHSQFSFVQEIPFGGTRSVPGFQNMTSGGDATHLYNLGFLYRDAAGILAVPASGCTVNGVATSPIEGLLNASKCFIATGAFRSGDAGPVLMLRRFRDRFLLKFSLGQHFVHWYYSWSPKPALWLFENPAFRIPVLVALFPLEVFAWFVLHPFAFLALTLLELMALALFSALPPKREAD